MIVTVSGYGATGSSAVIDLLKEYDEIDCPHENELDILYVPGGILNLDYSLNTITARFMQSDFALSNFKKIINHSKDNHNTYKAFTNEKFYDIATNYFNEICDCEWDGIVSYDHYYYSKLNIFYRYAFVRRIEKYFGKNVAKLTGTKHHRRMYFSINPNDFLQKTRKFISNVIESSGYKDGKIRLVNQLVPGNYVSECMKYIEENVKLLL